MSNRYGLLSEGDVVLYTIRDTEEQRILLVLNVDEDGEGHALREGEIDPNMMFHADLWDAEYEVL